MPIYALFGFVFILWSFVQANEVKNYDENASENEEVILAANPVDPFSAIEHIKYPNGLQVVLAPSSLAVNFEIRLEVLVGWESEGRTNAGLSHLLEHVLFRDKQLKDEMTYLQLIREAGGTANGSTGPRETRYYATIPAAKGLWLLDSFEKMILRPTIMDEHVELEKGTVELEIGEPSPIVAAMGFNLLDYLSPDYLNLPDFAETEFGIKPKPYYTKTEEQLSNRKLTAEMVRQQYEDYYYPQNMRLYIAGRFNRKKILDHIEKKWASLPAREGKKLAPPAKPYWAHNRPYKRITLTTDNPILYIGTKVLDLSMQEYEVLVSYMGYLSHRLMKEVRNLKGQTYSAYPYIDVRRGFGFVSVGFQTQKQNMKANMDLVEQKINSEARAGALTSEQVEEAKRLYMNKYAMAGKESNDMMKLAEEYQEILDHFGFFVSPFKVLKESNLDDYNAALKKYFIPQASYRYLYQPYFFFHYDIYFIYLLVAIGTFMGLRRQMTKPFAHDKVRWIRKLHLPPLHMLHGFALLLAWYLFAHYEYVLSMIFASNALQSHILVTEYLRSVFWAVGLLVAAQGMVSLVPHKLMVVGDQLVIKSASYYSTHIPLEQIEKVELVNIFSAIFARQVLKSLYKFRFYYFHPFMWRPGLMIQTKSGYSYFFSVRHSELAAKEVSRVLWDHRQSEQAVA